MKEEVYAIILFMRGLRFALFLFLISMLTFSRIQTAFTGGFFYIVFRRLLLFNQEGEQFTVRKKFADEVINEK